MNEAKIYLRLQKHYQAAIEHYGKDAVLGVFLYGSQNYGCSTEESDVDTKCILVPDIFHLACEPYKIKEIYVDNEKCNCVPIQHMTENWKKQNINFVEILFTPYFILNPDYNEFWEEFANDYKEEIAFYNPNRAIMSMGNQALHSISQNRKDFKKQMTCYRTVRSLEKLVDKVTKGQTGYWEVIHFNPDERNFLLTIRRYGLWESEIRLLEDKIKTFFSIATLCESSDKYRAKVDRILNNFIVEAIHIRERLD